ncbi:class I SAM-dependent methyltransferase [Clavibacter michiganensis]|uniref:Class I SAM-dependent methyltransferase n=1 Tax=Clavibacter michiganensis TaxID=28447 RepID=A0A2S5VUL1_9MICO|nr:class I SAM-dependent methyltransferase [Clavibacter michiganensis]PPF68522.1 class I SAM-dependent methyltransferase [Clavibacter michiganensis]
MTASQPTWFLDESTSLGRENTDAEHVAHYDEKEDASAAAEVDWLSTVLPERTGTVIDLGAGTGQFALLAAGHWANVVAVDPSPVMLRELRRKVAVTGAPVTVAQGGYLTFEWPAGSADLVYSRYALHHLPDFWKALALDRMRRMLRTGGVLRVWDVVYNFPVSEAVERIEHWCSTGYSDEEGGWTRADLEEHVTDEHSTFTWLLEPMFTQAGFSIERAEYDDDGIFAKYLLRAV